MPFEFRSRAEAPTAHASRYLQQLCKHWAHKFEVAFDADHGRIDFGDGRGCTLVAGADALLVEALSDDAAVQPKLQEIIERHVQRFAHREGELNFQWRPVDA